MLSAALLWTSLADVLADHSFPFSLSFQDVLHRVSRGPITAAVRSDEMRLPLDLLAGVGDSNGKAAIAHYRKIDHIVAHKGSLRLAQSFLPEDILEYSQLVLNSLVNVIHLKVAGAQGHGFGNALCDQAGFNT